MGEFDLQVTFDSMKCSVSEIRRALALNNPVVADRMAGALYDELHKTYQHLQKVDGK